VTEPGGKIPRLRSVALAGLGAFLTWQVLSRSLVAFFAESPEVALILRSGDPAALINMAERKLNLDHPSKSKEAPATQSGGDGSSDRISSFARKAKKAAGAEANQPEGEHPEAADPAERLRSNAGDSELRHEVRAIARAALSRDPMNARALRILGQVADADDDDLTASRLMQAAARRSLRKRIHSSGPKPPSTVAGQSSRAHGPQATIRDPGLRPARPATCPAPSRRCSRW